MTFMNFLTGIFQLIIPIMGALGLAVAYWTYLGIIQKPEGNDRMKEIAAQIREGAFAFLNSEARYLAVFASIVFILITFLLGFATGICYIFGSLCSIGVGFLGMRAATMSNARTAHAASLKSSREALLVAFNGGAVMGLAVASIGLLGLGLILWWFRLENLSSPLVGFGVGATSVALFARIGGGIYTKAADVGADLVGKVEAGIPEDDPRNPGVIADNVGDNVGDVAGMGADILESYVNSLVGCAAVGAVMAASHFAGVTTVDLADIATLTKENINSYRWLLVLTPFVLAMIGLVASFLGISYLRAQPEGEPTLLLRNATIVSAVIFLAASFAYFFFMPGIKFSLWFSVLFGTLCGLGIGLIAEYYTSSKPVYEIAEASKTGPATNLISGLAVGFRSVVGPLWVIAAAVLVANYFGGIYGVSLAAVGMLATTAIVMTIDAYGPIADNAGGISEMAGLGEETRAITDKLDAAGNTTAAIGKGFAVCSATLTAISLFGAYAETVLSKPGAAARFDLSLLNPHVTVGALVGASLAAIVACLTMTAVGRAAGKMVEEIRRQFREIPGLLEGRPDAKPDVTTCVDISTKAALSEMMLPGILTIIIPAAVGFFFNANALAGLLLGATLVSVVLALFMANAGGAWDNAKKFIEQGKIPGEKKGSNAHHAAVVGDTVGDPFKDTSGPSLNIVIKLVSMVALLIAPLIG